MRKIIVHLCPDLMNLYGENGNVRIMQAALAGPGDEVSVKRYTIGDTPDLQGASFIYCGAGTEFRRDMALGYLRPFAARLMEQIEQGVPVLFTGNSWEMLGQEITAADGRKREGLGLFDYSSAEDGERRIVEDAVFQSDICPEKFVGFVNKCSRVRGVSEPLFQVLMGVGNSPEEKGEGFRYRHFYGTELTGPILVKNPHFLRYLLRLINGGDDTGADLEYEERAYGVTLRELSRRMNRAGR